MSGSDELIYHVKFKADEDTLANVKRQIKDLEQAKEKVGTGDATEMNEEFNETLQQMSDEASEGIDRLVELQEQIDTYRASIKEISDAKKGDVDLSQQQRQSEARMRAELKSTQKEYRDQQKLFIANERAAEGQEMTYNQLVARNRELAEAMRDIPMEDQTGQLEELKEEWAANNETLKEFDSELGDHRRNVGNYSEAMSTAASAVAAVQGPLGPIAGRLSSINTTIKRSIPLLNAKAGAWVAMRRAMIGIVGLGVLAFFGAILAALRGLQPVIDQFTKRINQMSAAWGNFTDLVGSWLGMNERANVSMRESIELAGQMHERQIALEEQEIKNITRTAKLEEQIAKLRREAEDEMNTHEDRISMMGEAIDKTEELFDVQVAEQAQRVQMLSEEIDWAVSTRQEKEELAEAEARLIRLRAQQDTQSRQLVRRRQSVINQMQTEQEQRRRNIDSMREETREFIQASEDRIEQMRKEADLSIQEQRLDRRIELAKRYGDHERAIDLETQKAMEEVRREFSDRENEAVERSNEFLETQYELHLKEGLGQREAHNKAAIEAHEMFVEEQVALEEWRSSRVEMIQNEEREKLLDIDMKGMKERNEARENLAQMEDEREMKMEAKRLAAESDKNEQIIRLEQKRLQREQELRRKFEDLEISEEESRRMARQQSELEFEERLQQTKTDIRRGELEMRMDLEQAFADASIGIATAMFGDTKEVRIASAIIDTYTAANRALQSAPPPVSYAQAAAAIATGLANVRTIADTDVGDSQRGGGPRQGGMTGGVGIGRGFHEVGQESDSVIARQVAEQSSASTTEVNPTFVFEGDMNEEVMAIKVREGNRRIDTNTPTMKSRG